MTSSTSSSVAKLLEAGRLQEAEWLMRRGADAPLSVQQMAQQLGTNLKIKPFFISPGYYAPLPNWSEAVHCCGKAYQADSVVERYRVAAHNAINQHNQQLTIDGYSMRQLAALQHVWLAQNRPSTLKVLDFGGAMGTHFHKLAKHWPWCRLQWIVCETSTVAATGAAEFECDLPNGSQLRFSDKPEAVLNTACDLVFASCSLQYIEDWPRMLRSFRSAAWVLLDRVPLIDHPTDLIAIQVVPASYTDTRYPGWKFAAGTWISRLADVGLTSVLHWLVPEDRWTVLDINSGKLRWSAQHDHGFLLRTTSTVIF